MATSNWRLAKKQAQCLNETLCFVLSFEVADSLALRLRSGQALRNRQLLVAGKRCVQI